MMPNRLLIRLDQLLKAKGLSDRKACLRAKEVNPAIGVDFIRDLRRRQHIPRADKLAALAQVLDVAPAELLGLIEGLAPRNSRLEPSERFAPVPLVGTVQAGLWQSDFLSYEFYTEESVLAPPDPRYPGLPRVAFRVMGDSMDRLYPEGTIILAIRFYDLARAPRTGEKVIAVRQTDGVEEATIKEIELLPDGRVALWPRSSNPEYAMAIIAPTVEELMFPDDGAHPEVRVEALVVQSIRLE